MRKLTSNEILKTTGGITGGCTPVIEIPPTPPTPTLPTGGEDSSNEFSE